MAVSTAYAPLVFNGNGATTALSVTWPFFTGSLVVTAIDADGVETVKTITTHYTVSGGTDANGKPATGTVTMLVAPASGTQTSVSRSTALTQAATWGESDNFPQATVEAALDKLTLLAQERAYGATGTSMQLVTSGEDPDYWDADEHLISNVADPVSDQDVVTKAYGDDNYGAAAAAAAAASASAASASQSAAATSASAASTSASNASSSASAAAASAVTAAASVAAAGLPASISGQALKLLQVNAGETGYQFATLGNGDVVGPASSVDSEIALFSGTGGKTIKRASTTGLLKAASGVLAAAVDKTDYLTPATLAATTATNGASLIGIQDSGSLITATTVEGALAELAAAIGIYRPLTGLTLSNNGSDATNDIDVAAGMCTGDAGTMALVLASTCVKQVDVEFAEYSSIGTASGGRASADTTTGAKWFHVYLIGGSGKNTQPFFATSLSPTLPSGFTAKRRIGSVYWNGSALKAFQQVGDLFIWKALSTDISAAQGSSRSVYTVLVPTGLRTLYWCYASTSDTDTEYCWLMSPDFTDTAAAIGNATIISTDTGTRNLYDLWIPTDTSSQIAARSNGTINITVNGKGYRDLELGN